MSRRQKIILREGIMTKPYYEFHEEQEVVISPVRPKPGSLLWRDIMGKKAKVFYGLAIPNGRH